jgi:hypothetical protein
MTSTRPAVNDGKDNPTSVLPSTSPKLDNNNSASSSAEKRARCPAPGASGSAVSGITAIGEFDDLYVAPISADGNIVVGSRSVGESLGDGFRWSPSEGLTPIDFIPFARLLFGVALNPRGKREPWLLQLRDGCAGRRAVGHISAIVGASLVHISKAVVAPQRQNGGPYYDVEALGESFVRWLNRRCGARLEHWTELRN